MKTDRFPMVLTLGLSLLAAGALLAADTATVKKGKINVRGQASLTGETITQLKQGETVTILEEITPKNPKKGEPAKWAKIALPSNTPVWVFAPYVDSNKAVNINRVNVRGGPGENFSILARLERGAQVKEVRTVNNWMEIEPPTNCVAYVALDLLEKAPAVASAEPAPSAPTTAAPAPAVATTPVAAPEPAPAKVETVAVEPPAPAVDEKPAPVEKPQPKPEPAAPANAAAAAPIVVDSTPSTVPQVEPAAPAAPAPKRIVIREGRVVYARSVQAPTTFALESEETHRLINYLHSEETGLNLKSFAGRRVVVTGEELLDSRWAYTPILEVEDISVAK